MLLLLRRAHQKLRRDGLRVDAGRHEIVPAVPQHTDQLRRQQGIQQGHGLEVGLMAFRDGATLHVDASLPPKLSDVRQKCAGLLGRSLHHFPTVVGARAPSRFAGS